jgi:trehalose utilization protein
VAIRVTVWCEDLDDPEVAAVYPDGLHEAVAAGIREYGGDAVQVRTVTQDASDGDDFLDTTDVLAWWGHRRHDDVSDALAAAVQQRVLDGMGLVVLHSAHLSKPFRRLMGTSCNLRWREADDRELVWTVAPAHPIVRGVAPVVAIERQEMYGEFFDIPVPDELIFVSSFSGGEVFRSGCTFRRGHGKIFYFSPGDQDFPVYHHKDVRKVIANGVAWAKSDRPERAVPTLLRYETGDFFNGHGYTGAIEEPADA